ncbi:MAG: ABC transporter permease, partial [Oxalobacteraceae bacterium]
VFVLLATLSHWELYGAYVIAAIVRGLSVFSGLFMITLWFENHSFVAPLWIMLFALLGAAILATMGLLAGIWAEKFDQLAAFQNFLIVPATFLAGVFYSVHSLPPFWLAVSHANPFFYMIDGFRYGFFGHSDVPPTTSLLIVISFLVLLAGVAISLLKRGYKLRH